MSGQKTYKEKMKIGAVYFLLCQELNLMTLTS